MNVPRDVMKVRLERASELRRYAQLLESKGIYSTHKLYDAARILQENETAFHEPNTKNYACWGYEIEDLKIELSTNSRHIYPEAINRLEVIIDTKVLCHYQFWKSFKDPFITQNFRAVIRGIDPNSNIYSFGFHIDKHVHAATDGEIHPKYHIQYISRTRNDSDIGEVLSMDSPRIMHLPVDAILGIDLVLSNFAPSIWNKMRDEPEYHSIFKSYQESFWRPYIHTLASTWKYDSANLDWDGKHLICPNLSE